MPPASRMKDKNRIGPWRRLVQWGTSLLLLLLPWLEIDSQSLLRIDIPSLSLYLFGQVLRIQELYLVLLAALALTIGFLLVTVVLGRVWCGWLCPQTTLSDVAEWLARRLGLAVKQNRLHGRFSAKLLLQAVYLLLAFLVAANLLWYFIPPRSFFARLVTVDLHYAAWITLVLTGALVYIDLALVRRLLCRDFCPYGRIQTSLVDRATLTLHLPGSELVRCIDCGSCFRTCPMEIDIRDGYQVECTNCGLCLDACRRVMAKQGEPGLIRYTFGLHGEGAGSLLNPRVLLPAAATIILLVVLAAVMGDRTAASLKVAISHTARSRILADNQTGTFFNAWVHNRSQESVTYLLHARNRDSSEPLIVKGQVQATLAAGENRRLDFILLTPTGTSLPIEFVLFDKEGLELSAAEAYIEKIASE